MYIGKMFKMSLEEEKMDRNLIRNMIYYKAESE